MALVAQIQDEPLISQFSEPNCGALKEAKQNANDVW